MKKQPKRTTKRDKKRRLTKDLSPKNASAVKGGVTFLERKAGKEPPP